MGDALEEIVGVEDAGDLAGDLVEDAQGLGLAGDAGVESGVLDGDGHAGCDELKEALVFESEVADLLGLDVENADDLVLDDEGNGEFRTDVGVSVDVVVGCGDVFDEEGFALESGLAYDSLADFDAHTFDFGAVADLEAHAEVF